MVFFLSLTVSPATTFPYWNIQSCLWLWELTHDLGSPDRLQPISFVQPFQMQLINTTPQRKAFYLTASYRQCTQVSILLLHTLSRTKIRTHMQVLVVTLVIELDYCLSFHLNILISWKILDISLWRSDILKKVYEILGLKMCRAGYTKKDSIGNLSEENTWLKHLSEVLPKPLTIPKISWF